MELKGKEIANYEERKTINSFAFNGLKAEEIPNTERKIKRRVMMI